MGDIIYFRQREADKKALVITPEGKITGNQEPNREFGDRLDRIRASMEKINRLMAELKKMGEEQNVNNSPHPR